MLIDWIVDVGLKIQKKCYFIFMRQIFGSMNSSTENIAKVASFMESFVVARTSAASVFQVIDRKSKIDPLPSTNEQSSMNCGVQGNIAFKNVQFCYPSRPNVQVKVFVVFVTNFQSSSQFLRKSIYSYRFLMGLIWKFKRVKRWLSLEIQETESQLVCNFCKDFTIQTMVKF